MILAPRNDISGGRVLRSRTLNVVNRATQAFRQAAQSVARSDSAFGAYFRAMRARLGPIGCARSCGKSPQAGSSVSAEVGGHPKNRDLRDGSLLDQDCAERQGGKTERELRLIAHPPGSCARAVPAFGFVRIWTAYR